MATIIQDNLLNNVSDGRILQVVTAQGRQTYGFAHNLFNKYPNLYDGLKTELSDKPEENYARTISIAVTPNLVIDNDVYADTTTDIVRSNGEPYTGKLDVSSRVKHYMPNTEYIRLAIELGYIGLATINALPSRPAIKQTLTF